MLDEKFTPLTKQKLFDGIVLLKLTGTPIAGIEKNQMVFGVSILTMIAIKC